MHTVQQLLFAQHFPFSKASKHIVREENLSLAELPEAVVERAELMVKHALQAKKYLFELHSSDLLLQEVLAFPVAKILVSFVADPILYQRFSAMVANSAYAFLDRERDKGKATISLASDLNIKFGFSENKQFFVTLPLQEFLSIRFRDESLKLVNQFVSQGQVFLDLNSFCRFLREKSSLLILSSLPVPVKGLPKRLQQIANRLKAATKAREQKIFQAAFKGRVAPSAFPPCIASMYSQLASGQKLPHMANFTLATFLNSIAMPKQQILALFKKSPSFKERTAAYQINRIAKQNYAPPSCEKIRSYGYCPKTECRVKHPLSFYRRQLRGKRAEGQAKQVKEKQEQGKEKQEQAKGEQARDKQAKEALP